MSYTYLLKYLFYKQYFFSKCNSDKLPTFFHSLLGGCFFSKREQPRLSSSLFNKKTHPKVSEKKWATCQSCIRERGITFKLGTLVISPSQNFSARASQRYKDSEQRRAKLGHFNFRAETKLALFFYV